MDSPLVKKPIFRTSKALDRNALKYIVIVLMLVDHIVHQIEAVYGYDGTWYLLGRLISRLTAPIMCFFLAEGFRYTRNVKKYTARLGIFAAISHLPFLFFETGQWSPIGIFDGNVGADTVSALASASFFYLPGANVTVALYETSMIFTLFLGIVTLSLWEKTKWHPAVKVLLTAAVCVVATFGDWSYWAILYVLCFYFLREKPTAMWSAFIGVSALYIFNIDLSQGPFPLVFEPGFFPYRLGTLLVPLTVLWFYNGKPGSKAKFHKWFFYVFYPAHLVVLGILFHYVLA